MIARNVRDETCNKNRTRGSFGHAHRTPSYPLPLPKRKDSQTCFHILPLSCNFKVRIEFRLNHMKLDYKYS